MNLKQGELRTGGNMKIVDERRIVEKMSVPPAHVMPPRAKPGIDVGIVIALVISGVVLFFIVKIADWLRSVAW